MADILTQLQTCLDQLATQFYATLGYLTTYHDHSPAIPPPNVTDAAPALAKISKNGSAPPVPASVAASAAASGAAAGGAQSPLPPPTHQPGASGATEGEDPNQVPEPDSPRVFAARQRELARDLIIKEQQIEYLISVLPGIGASEAEQETRIRELEVQLRDVEKERVAKAQELKSLRHRLEEVLGAVSVGVYGGREIPK
ncbi:Mediator of RNA polymerase II transcription subunit 21 [Penicillium macrosclerotiorum]|uniref:Mediator of RNA polymerase II transcription subunit 21 n=1 Tax=Penicillium macrosclerotiorum TaxID=303699 RepID=UPI002546D3A0|nr:Mediator of RNA polymerase II transcription subunit 21 [Penicillium macrosclerotiorum]KAJ5679188.1 Mediator of RNA polymerase II transcription subunit 21 [Penicillium macrosclerotiorum]